MATFVPGVELAITAAEPLPEVQASPARPLRAGRHVLQLVVTANAGHASTPVNIDVVVRDPTRPTAVADFIADNGTRVYEPAAVVAHGKPFRLTGERSSDATGRVVSWRWTLLSKAS